MRRTDRPGFTFIELLVVMVVMGVLAAIGVPRIRNMKERAYQATLRSDLGALRTAQETFYSENLEYATDLRLLEFRSSSSVTIAIESGDPTRGWKAVARHEWLGTPCTTATGSEAVDVESGAIICANLATPAAATQAN